MSQTMGLYNEEQHPNFYLIADSYGIRNSKNWFILKNIESKFRVLGKF